VAILSGLPEAHRALQGEVLGFFGFFDDVLIGYFFCFDVAFLGAFSFVFNPNFFFFK
jgi:hypothetical protein